MFPKDMLEPFAVATLRNVDENNLDSDHVSGLSLVSLAISLKRIADAIAPIDGQDIGNTLWYIEQAVSRRD